MSAVSLHSISIGQGPPILILHGFLGMGDNWKTVGNFLAEHNYEIHLIDQRNHGRSPHTPEFSYDLLVEDLLRYIQERNLPKVILLGHSMGGKTVMEFACLYPDLVKSLIVVDIAPITYPRHHDEILNALRSIDFSNYESRGEVERALGEKISNRAVCMFLMKNVHRKTEGRYELRINLDSLIDNYDEIGKALSSDRTYSGPTLFIRGDKSKYIQEKDFHQIAFHFSKSNVVTIPGAGHWVHAEAYSQFTVQLLRFLTQNP